MNELEGFRGYMTVPEAAAALGITQEAVRLRLRSGHLPGMRVHPKLWLIPRSAIEPSQSQRTCPQCGRPLTGASQQRYCSGRCRSRASRHRVQHAADGERRQEGRE